MQQLCPRSNAGYPEHMAYQQHHDHLVVQHVLDAASMTVGSPRHEEVKILAVNVLHQHFGTYLSAQTLLTSNPPSSRTIKDAFRAQNAAKLGWTHY